MSTFYYGPALDSELDHRRTALLRDAATHRLARQARRAHRAAARAVPVHRPLPVPARTAAAVPAATLSAAPAPAEAGAGPARGQATRAA
jgi:hypothetical protein